VCRHPAPHIGRLLLAGVAFAVGDARAFAAELRNVAPLPFAAAVVLTVLFFAMFYAPSWPTRRRPRSRFRGWRSFPATWVSQAVNNVLSTGGLAHHPPGDRRTSPGAAMARSRATC
jgi:uncharacterized membrane protein YbhN (UPF0104 family)